MDAFYDGDLKDIWDSDLDPTESLKISSDHDMHDWFLDRHDKDPTVILNDKLISDALLNGTLPIKTEHSYSLNSDGDSLPDSPKSLQAKIDDMDDECYPAISLKTATSMRATIDPKILTLHPPTTNSRNSSNNSLLIPAPSNVAVRLEMDSLKTHNSSSTLGSLQLPQHLAAMYDDNDCSSSISSGREGSMSPDICSDIELDEAAIKDEPMSPDSSCPASPKSQSSMQQQLSLNLANLQTELLFEQKHGALLLAANNNVHNLIKTQQQQQQQQPLLIGNGQQSLMLPKIAIKSEKQSASSASLLTGLSKAHGNGSTGAAYGIPLTPPSSLPSDDSEGNLTPEHLFSPMSPNAGVSITVANGGNGTSSPNATDASSTTGRRSAGVHTAAGARHAANANVNGSATTTRQPIHTPLISTQPKGSTGTLLLTEEEKRTLLAEGYPIPQKLPLTKAEEKSLKKIRRKIKNKISAQESRRKKKEYMDQLERRVEILVTENHDYKKNIESLEHTNSNLLSQLHKLQALVNKHNVKKS